PSLKAPALMRYLPGMLLSVALERVNFMPDRVLVRSLRFGTLGLTRGGGELAYTAVSVAGAMLGWGGMAIVVGNLARSGVGFLVLMGLVNPRDWIFPGRLRWTVFSDLLSFGGMVSIGALASFAIRRWDNLVISFLYGPRVLAGYNLAYNLADIPAVQVGEQI